MHLIHRSPSDGSEWLVSHDASGHEWTARRRDGDDTVRGGSRLEVLEAVEDLLEEQGFRRGSKAPERLAEGSRAQASFRSANSIPAAKTWR